MKTKYLLKILPLLFMLVACKKNNETPNQFSSVNVVNVNSETPAIKISTSEKSIYWRLINDQVNYGGNRFYFTPLGMTTFKGVAASDTTKLLLNGKFNLTAELYTLFLIGNATTVETMLVEEKDFPYIRLDQVKPPSTDSVVNIRFANLSKNSPDLKVNVQNSILSEVTNLKYKEVSKWKSYVNNSVNGVNYNFEVREVATDFLVATYSFYATPTNLFKGVTLIIRGNFGTTTGSNALGITAINYF